MSHFYKLGWHPKSPTLFLPYAGLTQIQHSGQLPFHRQILWAAHQRTRWLLSSQFQLRSTQSKQTVCGLSVYHVIFQLMWYFFLNLMQQKDLWDSLEYQAEHTSYSCHDQFSTFHDLYSNFNFTCLLVPWFDSCSCPQALSQDHGRPLSNSSKSLAAVVARLERNAANSCMEGEEDLDEDRLAEEGEDADDEDDDMEAEHQQHHHQQQQQHLEVDTDCVSGVSAAVVPRVLYEELVHSYRQQEEEMRRLQQELERTRRQLVQQAKKLKEYGSLLTEVKELRDFNRRLQDVLLMRLGSGEGPGACTPTHTKHCYLCHKMC